MQVRICRTFAYNRTILELKPKELDNKDYNYIPYNRTILELKRDLQVSTHGAMGLIIAPFWN